MTSTTTKPPAQIPRSDPHAVKPGPRYPAWAGPAAAVALLAAATWLYIGYRYEAAIQPAFLSHVLRFSGGLQGDWFTSQPPSHWAIDHGLALFGNGSLREVAVLALWLAFLLVFWASFVSICDSLGAPAFVAVAAGLVLIPTRLGAFGTSDVMFDYFYPSMLGLALALAAFALLLRKRHLAAGVALGLAMLAHPGLGPLAAIALAPAALLATGRVDWRGFARFVIPAAVLGLPPLIQVLHGQVTGSTLSPSEQFDLIAIVRDPWHDLYRNFYSFEWIRTGIWAAVLALSLALLWRMRAARLIALLVGTVLVLCAIGAAASQHGGPVFLVNAQTARLSPLIVIGGAAAVAAALNRLVGPRWTAIGLIGIFLVTPRVAEDLRWTTTFGSALSATEASLALLGLLGALLLVYLWKMDISLFAAPVAATGVVFMLAAATVSMAVEHDTRRGNVTGEGNTPRSNPDEDELKAVGRAAKARTEPGQLVLGSPTFDGLRYWSERPDVVNFGMVPQGKGEDEWRARIIELTADPTILDADRFGTHVPERALAMEADYQRNIASNREPLCRYGARMVVARALASPPPWLEPVYSNPGYSLYNVRPGTCSKAHV